MTQQHEPSTDQVVKHLNDLGCEAVRLNCEEFALAVKCTVDLSGPARHFKIESDGAAITSGQIQSVWHRRWGYPAYPASFDEATISFCFSEATALMGGLPSSERLRWVNDIQAERKASNKILQLALVQDIGFRIPETIVTNDPNMVEEFMTRLQGGIIFKPVSGASVLYRTYVDRVIDTLEEKFVGAKINRGMPKVSQVLYTQLLTREKLKLIHTLKWSPAIFQEFIHKIADVRVTVVGSNIFSCLIHSQDKPETSVDFRVMNSGIDLKHEIIELPDHVSLFVKEITQRLKLEFACIDFVIDRASGEYVFLEVNPAGQWLWIESKTGLPISRAVAEHLMSDL